MKKIKVSSLEELRKISEEFLNNLNLKTDSNQASIVLLQGNLGSGKTTFTQNCAKCLGINENITSPTFVIQKRYEIKNHKYFKNLIHIDAYRLNSGKELGVLGFEEIVSDPSNLIFIEWPERVEEILLQENTNKIQFVFVDENTREICF